MIKQLKPHLLMFESSKQAFLEHNVQIVDDDLCLSLVKYNLAYYEDSLFKEFNIEFDGSLVNAVSKRKAEIIAGRIAAQKALAELACGSTGVAIGENRCPIWPDKMKGSITHSDQYALAAVGPQQKLDFIGIDLEILMSSEIANMSKELILTSCDYGQQTYLLSDKFELLMTIAFSAKESLFKALYPEVKRYFDFKDVAVTQLDLARGSFTIELLTQLTPTLVPHKKFQGAVVFYQDMLITMIEGCHC